MSASHVVRLDAPLFFEPFLRPQVWGGRRLQSLLHKPLPDSGSYGEAWELCPLSQAISRVADGPQRGLMLNDLWQSGLAEQAGVPVSSGFPWLVKWLDIHDRLSVQVHPNDEQARRLLGESCGKSEAWVVVHAEPTALVYAGFQPGVTDTDVRRAVAKGNLVECLHAFTPHVGDCLNFPAGTVHAAGHGLVLAEVQQPSDATFRLFDWNRLGTDGQPRALHVEQALACVSWPQAPVTAATPAPLPIGQGTTTAERLLSTPHFEFDRFHMKGTWDDDAERLAVWMVLAGHAAIEWSGGTRSLRAGDTVLVPRAVQDLCWQPEAPGGEVSLLRIRLPQSTD